MNEVQAANASDQPDELICFVIGPIGDRLSDAGTEERDRYEQAILTFENVIEPACHEVGVTDPVRADGYAIAGEIPDQVFRHLRDADVVIADLTGANPNVMYELGLRHSRDKLTIQVGEQQTLPFDVRAIRTVQFKRTEGGYIDAKNELKKMLERGLTGTFERATATRIWNEGWDGRGEGRAGPSGPDSPRGPSGHRPSGEPGPSGSAAVDRLDEAAYAGSETDEAGPPGYIELLVEMEDALPRVNESLGELSNIMQEFGDIADRGTAEVEDNKAKGSGAKGQLLAAIRFAERLDDPIDRFAETASQLRADTALVDRGLGHIFAVIRDGNYAPSESSEIKDGLASFVESRDAYRNARRSIEEFRDTSAGLSGIARPIDTRMSRLTKLIDQVLDASSVFDHWGEQAEELLALVKSREAQDGSSGDGQISS